MRGQVVLVTGAASGIGAAGAAELQRRGALPVLVDQDAEGLAAQADTLTTPSAELPLTVTCDITSLAACEAAVLTHGGMGYAREYHVERYFREAMIARIAPVSREMICNYIAEQVLDLPKSY